MVRMCDVLDCCRECNSIGYISKKKYSLFMPPVEGARDVPWKELEWFSPDLHWDLRHDLWREEER